MVTNTKVFFKYKVCIYLFMPLLLSYAGTNLSLAGNNNKTSSEVEQEIMMPNETDRQKNISNMAELQPMISSTEEDSKTDLLSSAKIESITITSDVVIPEYKPLDVPYSKWETYRSQELLETNGFGNTISEWRRASQHSSGLIRSAAYYLLIPYAEQQDEVLFRQGLKDIDETVQTLSAYGLYILGDKSAVLTLKRIALLDVNTHLAAIRAAGILAEIGEPTAFVTIEKAINSDLDYIRLFAIQNTIFFVPLHGQIYASGKTIDIWNCYTQALLDENAQVRSVAKLQLKELNSPEALKLLQKHFDHPL